jgi:uncharacterized membrane protein YbhN (UPF0104 family)
LSPTHRTYRGLARAGGSAVLAVLLLGLVLPRAAGVGWRDALAAMSGLTLVQLAGLGVIWFAGIWAHSFVLRAGLPGLSSRKAVMLNLSGSAVSNLVPCGGALGIGLNYAMCSSWGVTSTEFTLYTLVTNLWNVLTKLSLPTVALLAMLAVGNVTAPTVVLTSLAALVMLVGLVAAACAVVANDTAAFRVGAVADWVARSICRLVRRGRPNGIQGFLSDVRRGGRTVMRRGWRQLTLGMLSYSALQGLLLWAALSMLGSTLGPAQILAGYAAERVLSIAVLTPGGSGLVEVGMTAVLVGLGGDPVVTVAGVLVYRAFVFGLEIPAGAAALAWWLWSRMRLGSPPHGVAPQTAVRASAG